MKHEKSLLDHHADALRVYEKRLQIQRFSLSGAQHDLANADKRCRYWLDECLITRRKILEIERELVELQNGR